MNAIRPEPVPSGQPNQNRFYTQVNILFPSEQVELPSAERFKEFPPDAQKAILAAFEREQIERHAWLKIQQKNDHEFNMANSKYYFSWKMGGLLMSGLISLGAILAGVWLVKNGASGAGAALIIGSAAALVGTAIWGHKASLSQPKEENRSTEEPTNPALPAPTAPPSSS